MPHYTTDTRSEQLFSGGRSTSPETAQRLFEGSLESDVDPRLGSQPDVPSDLFDPDAGAAFWESPTSAAIAEEGTGSDVSTTDPSRTPGVETTGPTIPDLQEGARNVEFPEFPEFPQPDFSGVADAIVKAAVVIVLGLVAIFTLGQFAKGAGQGAVS